MPAEYSILQLRLSLADRAKLERIAQAERQTLTGMLRKLVATAPEAKSEEKETK
jgi:hypothetical protein